MTAIDTQERVLPLGTARPDYPGLPLPSWVQSLREHQVTAVREIVEAFEDVDVVFLDAPVGAGKTLIGELVRHEMNVDKGLYVCTDKALQDQFLPRLRLRPCAQREGELRAPQRLRVDHL